MGSTQTKGKILDGPFIEVQGSSGTYKVFALGTAKQWCTCPSYKFQKLPVEQRECKHTRKLKEAGAALPLAQY